MNRMTMLMQAPQPPPRSIYSYAATSSEASSRETSPGMRARNNSGSSQRTSPSFLNGVRGLLHRPRSESLGEKMFRRAEVMRRVQVAECSVDQVYDLRDMKKNLYDDEAAFRRPRSNSSDFLILRKTSRPLSVHVVGLVDAQCDPYRQYMKVVDCYELSPSMNRVIAIDFKLPVRNAFEVMREFNLAALLVWNSEEQVMSSILTLTDLLVCLREDPQKTLEALENEAKKSETAENDEKKEKEDLRVCDILSGNQLVSVCATDKILNACEVIRSNKVHRLLVKDESGNALYFLTNRRVLTAIHKQNRSLHFAQWLSRPIGKSTIGTWDNIRTIPKTATIMQAVDGMLGYRFSVLPVVDEQNKTLGVITKRDIAAQIPANHSNPREWMETTKVEDIRQHCNNHIFVSGKDTTGFVLDALLSGRSRCAFIIQDHKVIGAISLSDVLGYLLREESQPPTPDSGVTSSSSSTENVPAKE
ncbi:unnamed protein product [Caenorhabditis auriculariae]|uniref:CBS domain-containing protein n=1 Tax=Caenorhabditis auriculariae TaxID=2777116 RepID=A0A8S1HY93_9PELO|nr:unnamed protein product [Caenorhabditis auriculariae]